MGDFPVNLTEPRAAQVAGKMVSLAVSETVFPEEKGESQWAG